MGWRPDPESALIWLAVVVVVAVIALFEMALNGDDEDSPK